jgi:hypothetical protein
VGLGVRIGLCGELIASGAGCDDREQALIQAIDTIDSCLRAGYCVDVPDGLRERASFGMLK